MTRWSRIHAALLVSYAGLFATVVLSLGRVLDLPVPCGASSGCGAVAHHPSSAIGGVPLSFLGVAAFTLALALVLRAADSVLARATLVVLTGLAASIGAALVVYSQSVIKATCIWCIASEALFVSLFALSVAIFRDRGPRSRPSSRATLIGALVTAAAVGVQAGAMTNAANAPPIPAAIAARLTVGELVDPAKATGPADAPVTVVMFSDFMCPACRAAHADLVAWRDANPKGVRLAYRHMPLWELSAASAAVAEVAAEKGRFWDFAATAFRGFGRFDRDGFQKAIESVGLEFDVVEARVARGDDPAVLRLKEDALLAERLGIHSTPAFVVIVQGVDPVSASLKSLGRLLDAPVVRAALLKAAGAVESK